MSLLNKATIITTPTAHGNGTLHSIKGGAVADFDVVRGSAATRVNAEGLIEDISILSGELVTNGLFDTDTSWTKVSNTAISGGKANAVSNVNGFFIIQTSTLDVSKTYKLTLDLTDYTSGTLQFATADGDVSFSNTLGAKELIFKPISSNILFKNANAPATLSIDNVSIKEVIDATNIPRIDYTTGEGVVLLEPQSTNLITQSELFSDSSWEKNPTLTVTPNDAISPSGETNASRVNKVGTGSRLGAEISLTSGQSYTLSFYMKNNGGNTSFNAGFDGQSASQSYIITDDWKRYEFTFIATTTETSQIRLFDSAVNIDAYIYGAQLEALPYATSCIPTSGAIATRLADSVSGAGDATTFNSTEGVLYFEGAALSNDLTNRSITLWDGTDTNRLVVKYDNQSNVVQVFNRVGGVLTAFLEHTLADITISQKIAVRYKANDYALVIDGVEVDTDTSGTTWSASVLNNIKISNGSGSDFYGKVKALAVFNEALTDSELECLTKI